MLYYRRKILLSCIAAFDDRGIDAIKLQTILFLLCQQQNPAFDFVPFHYGCYSFQAAKDLQILENHYKSISQKENNFFINQVLNHQLRNQEQRLVDELCNDFKRKSIAETVNYVYDKFPYFAINSQWTMTSKQKQRTIRTKKEIAKKTQTCLFTLGYEGKSIDSYLNQLICNNVKLLYDVRRKPLSMKYGFCKNQLKKYCSSLGILYEHSPELGIDAEKRQSLRTLANYKMIFDEYRQDLAAKKRNLYNILALLQQHHRIALTCFEKTPEECHRHCISDYLVDNYAVPCQHL